MREHSRITSLGPEREAREEPYKRRHGQWGSICSRMPRSCAEWGGDLLPSPPRQRAAAVSGAEGAGGEALAPRHFLTDRACCAGFGVRAQLRTAGVILRNAALGGMMAYHLPHLPCVYLRVCGPETQVLVRASSSHGLLTACGFPNLTHFRLAKEAAAVS